MNKNEQGLSRNIPESVKREVRQRCGFGCVFCGISIYQFEHIDPDFCDASEHNPDNICLLCPTHHQKVTNKRLSKEQVKESYKNPIALRRGYSNDFLELGRKFNIMLGDILFRNGPNLVTIDGEVVLSIEQATDKEPMQISGMFYDNKGELVLELRRNEIFGYTKNWDIEQKASRTTIRRKGGEVILAFEIDLPNTLRFERLDMDYKTAKIIIDASIEKIFLQTMTDTPASVDFHGIKMVTENLVINKNSIQLGPTTMGSSVNLDDYKIKELDL